MPPDKENTVSQHQIRFLIPVHMYPFLFEIRDLFFRFGLSFTRIQLRQSPKTHLLKNALQREEFWKLRTRLNGWKQRFFLKKKKPKKKLRRVVGYQRMRTLPTRIFWKGRKTLRFSKLSGYVWPLSSQPVCIFYREHYFNRSRSRGSVSG